MTKTTYESTYNNHPIMTNQEKQQGCNELILEKIDQMMNHAVNQHNKVFFMRMDLRFPQGSSCPGDNRLFSNFQEAYMRHLRRHDLDLDAMTRTGNGSGRSSGAINVRVKF